MRPLPAVTSASIVSSSPPTSVNARPVAMPTWSVSSLLAEAVLRHAQVLAHLLGADRGRGLAVVRDDLARELAADRADLALEAADAGFLGVAPDHLVQAGVGELDRLALEPVLLDLLRDQELLGDLELLFLDVAGQLDDLHAVLERPRDRRERVRGGDEQDLRQVVLEVEVVVVEGLVLLGVEHFEQRRRRVAAEVGRHLVDLVEQEHRVARAGLLQALDDLAGQRADVGAPVAADLGLVAHAAQ